MFFFLPFCVFLVPVHRVAFVCASESVIGHSLFQSDLTSRVGSCGGRPPPNFYRNRCDGGGNDGLPPNREDLIDFSVHTVNVVVR